MRPKKVYKVNGVFQANRIIFFEFFFLHSIEEGLRQILVYLTLYLEVYIKSYGEKTKIFDSSKTSKKTKNSDQNYSFNNVNSSQNELRKYDEYQSSWSKQHTKVKFISQR